MTEPKIEKDILENPFFKKVLPSVGEDNRTREDVQKKYMKLFPPRFYTIRKRLGLIVTVRKVGFALTKLCDAGLVKKNLVWCTSELSDSETFVYQLSNKGRSVLLGKNRK